MPTEPGEHSISPDLLKRQVRVTVAGCGGTGSAIAAGLPLQHQAMMALGHPYGLHVTLVDGDRISATNCVRQPFSESEIGLYKATVLATRINVFWGLAWTGAPEFLDGGWRAATDILISCVDSRRARKEIMESHVYDDCYYWLDLGNTSDRGQFVLGQPKNRRNEKVARRLPTVAELFPEIVDPKLDKKDKLPSCSALEALEQQRPFLNQSLAYPALGLLSHLFRNGRLSCQGGFFNLTTLTMAPIMVNQPDFPAKPIGRKDKNLDRLER